MKLNYILCLEAKSYWDLTPGCAHSGQDIFTILLKKTTKHKLGLSRQHPYINPLHNIALGSTNNLLLQLLIFISISIINLPFHFFLFNDCAIYLLHIMLVYYNFYLPNTKYLFTKICTSCMLPTYIKKCIT